MQIAHLLTNRGRAEGLQQSDFSLHLPITCSTPCKEVLQRQVIMH